MKNSLDRNKNSTVSSEFLLNIRYHQHNSWQGSVQRLDTGETVNFRSALELIYLIEDVAGKQAIKGDNTHRTRIWKKTNEVAHPILQNGRSS